MSASAPAADEENQRLTSPLSVSSVAVAVTNSAPPADEVDDAELDMELEDAASAGPRRALYRRIAQVFALVLVITAAAAVLLRSGALAGLNGSSNGELRVHAGELQGSTQTYTRDKDAAAPPATTPAPCPTTPTTPTTTASPSAAASASSAYAPFVPRPMELVGVPAPIEPILPSRAPDGSYMPYHTSITDAIVYDVYSPPPMPPQKLLHAHQALPALSGTHFGARYIRTGNSDPGRFNNLRYMLMSLLWLGRLLNRTVVWPENPHTQLAQLIDMDRLSALHPVISEKELPGGWEKDHARMTLTEGHDVIFPSKADYEAQPDQAAWFKGQTQYSPRFLHDEWGVGSGVNDKMVLVFDQLWPNTRVLFGGFTPAMHSSIDLWTMDAFRMQPSLLSLADRALESMQATRVDGADKFPADGRPPSYDLSAGIHWRLGDYVGHPTFGPKVISVDAAVAWTQDCIAKEKAAGRDTSRFTVYIATEGQPTPIVQYKERAKALGVFAVWLWSDVSSSAAFDTVRRWHTSEHALASDGTANGIVEVMLLSQPRYFLGTARSTFTEAIICARGTSVAHRADALQQLRWWDQNSGEPNAGGFAAAVWPPDAYEPLPAQPTCPKPDSAPAAASAAPSAAPSAALSPSAAQRCDPQTPVTFHPWTAAKPPSHFLSETARLMWRDAIMPAKRT